MCSFRGSAATAAAAAAATAASGTSLSRERGSELPAATITLGKLAGFRLAAREREVPTCHSAPLSRGSQRDGWSARTRLSQTRKGTRQLRNSPAVPGHFRGNNRLALFLPLANWIFFFFLSYLAAVSDSTSPPRPHAFCFSSEIRTELDIFVNCRWGSPAGGFHQAKVACAPSLVCSPLNCKGIKFSSSC